MHYGEWNLFFIFLNIELYTQTMKFNPFSFLMSLINHESEIESNLHSLTTWKLLFFFKWIWMIWLYSYNSFPRFTKSRASMIKMIFYWKYLLLDCWIIAQNYLETSFVQKRHQKETRQELRRFLSFWIGRDNNMSE